MFNNESASSHLILLSCNIYTTTFFSILFWFPLLSLFPIVYIVYHHCFPLNQKQNCNLQNVDNILFMSKKYTSKANVPLATEFGKYAIHFTQIYLHLLLLISILLYFSWVTKFLSDQLFQYACPTNYSLMFPSPTTLIHTRLSYKPSTGQTLRNLQWWL